MDVLMPQLGETVAEGKITKWFKSAGEEVKPGDNLLEIETDKVSMEVPSTTSGVLAEIRVPAGVVAPVGAVVGVIAGRGGGGASVFAAALAQSAADALLVDADPWGGGIDLVLGCEGETGLRWPDLALQGGRLSYASLRDALPQRCGVSVLSGSRAGSDIGAAPLGAVIDWAR